jgi:NDP-sugar pyrophosphorylase family protein
MTDLQLVIPMAGLGKRFADAGYTLPKPLIPVGGLPMVVRVVRHLPPAERVVFVAHPEHAAKHPLADLLREHVPGARLVVAPGLTDGQACSVRLAADHLDPARPVLVAACDNLHVYDPARFREATEAGFDALVWTFRRDPRVLVNPKAYGWVKTDGERATGVSVKVPISDTPMSDHAVTGTFWFRTAARLIGGIDRLVAANRRVNSEFYLDSVPGLLAESGQRVGVFEADKYIGWGTPDDFEDYLRWERHFLSRDDRTARQGSA